MNESPPVDSFGPLAKLLSGGLAILVTTATTVGAATGGVAYLLRNAPGRMQAALALAAVAVLCALIAAIWPAKRIDGSWVVRALLVGVSAASLAAGMVLVLLTQTDLLRQASRPVIAVQWTTVGGGPALQLAVDADALATDDQLYSAVVAVGSKPAPGPTPSQAGAAPAVQSARFTIYAGSTGPDQNGHGKQTQQVVVPTKVEGYTIESVQIAAVVLKQKALAVLLRRAAAPSPTGYPTASASPRSTAPPPVPVPRIISLSCDGKITTADSATGSQIQELKERVGRPACVNLSALPERSRAPGS